MKFTMEIGGALTVTTDREGARLHILGALLATQEQPDLVAARYSAGVTIGMIERSEAGEVLVQELANGRKLIAWKGESE